jgi:hypothetical protein
MNSCAPFGAEEGVLARRRFHPSTTFLSRPPSAAVWKVGTRARDHGEEQRDETGARLQWLMYETVLAAKWT